VFEGDKQIKRFMEVMDDFFNTHMDLEEYLETEVMVEG
jgi:hypothetical protein